ncbi:MAG TPA: crotonase/enoyl-CoA hydratase family protein [Dehalococcoidia bacterium]|nr:crotonase/enoyl-CoA hydratase family protein [Dehalococcoidia bacterium]
MAEEKQPAVIYEKKDHIAIVTMNRRQAMNAMDDEMMERLSDAWMDIRDDRNIWVAIITGAGKTAFSVGGDLQTFLPRITEADLRDLQSDTRPLNAVLRGFDLWKPVIAAVNGYCLGGGLEMLLGTDIRVASENAVFAVMEPTWALFPGGGTTVRLPRQIPYCRAMEMLLTANQFTAQEAYEIGLINKVVPREELMPTAMQYAEKICSNGPLAVQAIKESVLRGLALDAAYSIERLQSWIIFDTEDAKEGPKAFMEKRPPVWKGK